MKGPRATVHIMPSVDGRLVETTISLTVLPEHARKLGDRLIALADELETNQAKKRARRKKQVTK